MNLLRCWEALCMVVYVAALIAFANKLSFSASPTFLSASPYEALKGENAAVRPLSLNSKSPQDRIEDSDQSESSSTTARASRWQEEIVVPSVGKATEGEENEKEALRSTAELTSKVADGYSSESEAGSAAAQPEIVDNEVSTLHDGQLAGGGENSQFPELLSLHPQNFSLAGTVPHNVEHSANVPLVDPTVDALAREDLPPIRAETHEADIGLDSGKLIMGYPDAALQQATPVLHQDRLAVDNADEELSHDANRMEMSAALREEGTSSSPSAEDDSIEHLPARDAEERTDRLPIEPSVDGTEINAAQQFESPLDMEGGSYQHSIHQDELPPMLPNPATNSALKEEDEEEEDIAQTLQPFPGLEEQRPDDKQPPPPIERGREVLVQGALALWGMAVLLSSLILAARWILQGQGAIQVPHRSSTTATDGAEKLTDGDRESFLVAVHQLGAKLTLWLVCGVGPLRMLCVALSATSNITSESLRPWTAGLGELAIWLTTAYVVLTAADWQILRKAFAAKEKRLQDTPPTIVIISTRPVSHGSLALVAPTFTHLKPLDAYTQQERTKRLRISLLSACIAWQHIVYAWYMSTPHAGLFGGAVAALFLCLFNHLWIELSPLAAQCLELSPDAAEVEILGLLSTVIAPWGIALVRWGWLATSSQSGLSSVVEWVWRVYALPCVMEHTLTGVIRPMLTELRTSFGDKLGDALLGEHEERSRWRSDKVRPLAASAVCALLTFGLAMPSLAIPVGLSLYIHTRQNT